MVSEQNSLIVQNLQVQNPSKNLTIHEMQYLSEITPQDIRNFIGNYFKFENTLYLTVSNYDSASKSIAFSGTKDDFSN